MAQRSNLLASCAIPLSRSEAIFDDPEQKKVGWMLIINGLADDERIADFAGAWIDQWHKRYVQ